MLRYAITEGLGPLPERVDFVQLRAKTIEAGELAARAKRLIRELGDKVSILINGRADVALAVGAAGVHLTALEAELTPAQVRQIFVMAKRPRPLVSVSCHTLEDVKRARANEADIILFGPVFEKRVDREVVNVGVGLEKLQKACVAAGGVPVLALGGVTADNSDACRKAGAAGVAGIRLFA